MRWLAWWLLFLTLAVAVAADPAAVTVPLPSHPFGMISDSAGAAVFELKRPSYKKYQVFNPVIPPSERVYLPPPDIPPRHSVDVPLSPPKRHVSSSAEVSTEARSRDSTSFLQAPYEWVHHTPTGSKHKFSVNNLGQSDQVLEQFWSGANGGRPYKTEGKETEAETIIDSGVEKGISHEELFVKASLLKRNGEIRKLTKGRGIDYAAVSSQVENSGYSSTGRNPLAGWKAHEVTKFENYDGRNEASYSNRSRSFSAATRRETIRVGFWRCDRRRRRQSAPSRISESRIEDLDATAEDSAEILTKCVCETNAAPSSSKIFPYAISHSVDGSAPKSKTSQALAELCAPCAAREEVEVEPAVMPPPGENSSHQSASASKSVTRMPSAPSVAPVAPQSANLIPAPISHPAPKIVETTINSKENSYGSEVPAAEPAPPTAGRNPPSSPAIEPPPAPEVASPSYASVGETPPPAVATESPAPPPPASIPSNPSPTLSSASISAPSYPSSAQIPAEVPSNPSPAAIPAPSYPSPAPSAPPPSNIPSPAPSPVEVPSYPAPAAPENTSPSPAETSISSGSSSYPAPSSSVQSGPVPPPAVPAPSVSYPSPAAQSVPSPSSGSYGGEEVPNNVEISPPSPPEEQIMPVPPPSSGYGIPQTTSSIPSPSPAIPSSSGGAVYTPGSSEESDLNYSSGSTGGSSSGGSSSYSSGGAEGSSGTSGSSSSGGAESSSGSSGSSYSAGGNSGSSTGSSYSSGTSGSGSSYSSGGSSSGDYSGESGSGSVGKTGSSYSAESSSLSGSSGSSYSAGGAESSSSSVGSSYSAGGSSSGGSSSSGSSSSSYSAGESSSGSSYSSSGSSGNSGSSYSAGGSSSGGSDSYGSSGSTYSAGGSAGTSGSSYSAGGSSSSSGGSGSSATFENAGSGGSYASGESGSSYSMSGSASTTHEEEAKIAPPVAYVPEENLPNEEAESSYSNLEEDHGNKAAVSQVEETQDRATEVQPQPKIKVEPSSYVTSQEYQSVSGSAHHSVGGYAQTSSSGAAGYQQPVQPQIATNVQPLQVQQPSYNILPQPSPVQVYPQSPTYSPPQVSYVQPQVPSYPSQQSSSCCGGQLFGQQGNLCMPINYNPCQMSSCGSSCGADSCGGGCQQQASSCGGCSPSCPSSCQSSCGGGSCCQMTSPLCCSGGPVPANPCCNTSIQACCPAAMTSCCNQGNQSCCPQPIQSCCCSQSICRRKKRSIGHLLGLCSLSAKKL